MSNRLSITMEGDVKLGLERLAEETGRGLADLVNQACIELLDRDLWGKTVGSVAETSILGGATNEEALAAVLAKHPTANTSLRSIAWYRSKLRRERPEVVLTDAEVRAARASEA